MSFKKHVSDQTFQVTSSAVFSDFVAPMQELSCGPWNNDSQEFMVTVTGQIFKNFVAQNWTFWASLNVSHDSMVKKFFFKLLCPIAAPCKVCGPPAIAGGVGP